MYYKNYQRNGYNPPPKQQRSWAQILCLAHSSFTQVLRPLGQIRAESKQVWPHARPEKVRRGYREWDVGTKALVKLVKGSFMLLHQFSQRTPAASLSQSFVGKKTWGINPLLGAEGNQHLLEGPSSPGGEQPQDTVPPTWAQLSSGDPPGTMDPPLRQRCPPWCPGVVRQTWGHMASAVEQKVWIQPCLAWARAEPSPDLPLLGTNALLGHPFWGAVLQKARGALLKVWLSSGH